MGVCHGLGSKVDVVDVNVAVGEQMVKTLLMVFYLLSDLEKFFLLGGNFSVEGMLVGDIKGCIKELGDFSLLVTDRCNVKFDVVLDTEFGVFHDLAHLQASVSVFRWIGIAEEWYVVHVHGCPEAFVVGVLKTTKFFHLIVDNDVPSILAVKGHGKGGIVEEIVEFANYVLAFFVFFKSVGDVVDDVDDVFWLSFPVKFDNGMSVESKPLWSMARACIPPFFNLELALSPTEEKFYLLGEFILFVGVDTCDELFECDALLWEDGTVTVGEDVVADVVLHHMKVAHVQGFVHHPVEVG